MAGVDKNINLSVKKTLLAHAKTLKAAMIANINRFIPEPIGGCGPRYIYIAQF